MSDTPKRLGRPPLDEDDRSVPVSFSVPSKQFDELCARASREGVSVPEIIRRELDKTLKSRRQP